MKRLNPLIFFISVIVFCQTGYSSDFRGNSTTLTFSTFNMAYFGLGGKMSGTPADEKRDSSFRNFIASEFPQSDVISFQEVVDIERLKANVLPKGWDCITYDHVDPKHQHVVLCVRAGLQFQHEPSDNNDIVDDVAYNDGRSRPALHVIIADKSGHAITRVLAVHLKAFPNFSLKRYHQAKVIGMYLQGVADPALPFVILGDLNTYPSEQNGQQLDDASAIQTIFNKYSPGVAEVKTSSKYTYRTQKLASYFDRIWRSSTIEEVRPANVYSVCSSTDLKAIEKYNLALSDHCPVTATLSFPK